MTISTPALTRRRFLAAAATAAIPLLDLPGAVAGTRPDASRTLILVDGMGPETQGWLAATLAALPSRPETRRMLAVSSETVCRGWGGLAIVHVDPPVFGRMPAAAIAALSGTSGPARIALAPDILDGGGDRASPFLHWQALGDVMERARIAHAIVPIRRFDGASGTSAKSLQSLCNWLAGAGRGTRLLTQRDVSWPVSDVSA